MPELFSDRQVANIQRWKEVWGVDATSLVNRFIPGSLDLEPWAEREERLREEQNGQTASKEVEETVWVYAQVGELRDTVQHHTECMHRLQADATAAAKEMGKLGSSLTQAALDINRLYLKSKQLKRSYYTSNEELHVSMRRFMDEVTEKEATRQVAFLA